MKTHSSVYKLIKAKAATYKIPPKNISRWLKFSEIGKKEGVRKAAFP
jgi:hypothetical protein